MTNLALPYYGGQQYYADFWEKKIFIFLTKEEIKKRERWSTSCITILWCWQTYQKKRHDFSILFLCSEEEKNNVFISLSDFKKSEEQRKRQHFCRWGKKKNSWYYTSYTKKYYIISRLQSVKYEEPLLEEGNKKKMTLNECLRLLNHAFTINKNVKKNAYSSSIQTCTKCDHWCDRCDWDWFYVHTEVDYDLRDRMYDQKYWLIRLCIEGIKNNRLPIKYGKNDWIIYFQYLGEQVSFHDPKDHFPNIKKFNGSRTWVPNKKIPFAWVK